MAISGTKQALSVHQFLGSLAWLEPCCSVVGIPGLCSCDSPWAELAALQEVHPVPALHTPPAYQTLKGEVGLDLQVWQCWH